MAENKTIVLLDGNMLQEKLYLIRGQYVMLDFELAEIYGYSTKAFNQQVSHNKNKFPPDFRFRLLKEEWSNLRSKYLTSSWGGTRYPPYAFTEAGVYMLMTVLKGEIATIQSIKLIRLFKEMKDYLASGVGRFAETAVKMLLDEVRQNKEKIELHAEAIQRLETEMVGRGELAEFIQLFDKSIDRDEILILDGEPFTADLAYQRIYEQARKSIIVIDDYIGLKTLQHLTVARQNIRITIISDNKGNRPLRSSEVQDWQQEYPGRNILFLQSHNKIHDRYIVLDESTKGMILYHCGASSKDAGNRITTITRIQNPREYKVVLSGLLSGEELIIK